MTGDLAITRACWIKGRLRDGGRDDYMLIDVEPPVVGQPFGLGDEDINQLIISTRHQGYTLFPVTEWSSSVYIARILDPSILETKSFSKDQVALIGWGEIFRTEAERIPNKYKAGS